MITVICGTNRTENITQSVAQTCERLLSEQGETVQLFRLEDVPPNFAFQNEAYQTTTPAFTALVDQYIRPVDKLVIVSPEYNGSIPGVLKVWIDAVQPVDWRGKKAALVGVASGRAGNLRGLDHLTNILHYLDVDVMPLKVPISKVYGLLDNQNHLVDEATLDVLQQQMQRFTDF